jgi:hypothetical protein
MQKIFAKKKFRRKHSAKRHFAKKIKHRLKKNSFSDTFSATNKFSRR